MNAPDLEVNADAPVEGAADVPEKTVVEETAAAKAVASEALTPGAEETADRLDRLPLQEVLRIALECEKPHE